MPERQTIVLPVWGVADPTSRDLRFRLQMLDMLIKDAPIVDGNRVLDTPALAKACLDTLAWLYAHGNKATDRRTARLFGQEQGKAIAERMLQWRQDFETGRLQPMSLIPLDAVKH